MLGNRFPSDWWRVFSVTATRATDETWAFFIFSITRWAARTPNIEMTAVFVDLTSLDEVKVYLCEFLLFGAYLMCFNGRFWIGYWLWSKKVLFDRGSVLSIVLDFIYMYVYKKHWCIRDLCRYAIVDLRDIENRYYSKIFVLLFIERGLTLCTEKYVNT